jgi:hypothetical protein
MSKIYLDYNLLFYHNRNIIVVVKISNKIKQDVLYLISILKIIVEN